VSACNLISRYEMRTIRGGELSRVCGLQMDEIKEAGERYLTSRRSNQNEGGEKDMQRS
jgi:hypothetical protein